MDEDRRKMLMDHFMEIGIGKSNGDVISGLGRHLATEFTFSQISGKPSQTDQKCQWITYRKLGRGIMQWRHFCSTNLHFRKLQENRLNY
jgi:hypothetical protein